MRWPIRNQILFPFLLIQLTTLTAVTATSAWMAVRQVDQEIHERLKSVLSTLQTASYPLTPSVLNQLHDLSGAHFAVVGPSYEVSAATLPEMERVVLNLPPGQWTALGSRVVRDHSQLSIGGEVYFAGRVHRLAGDAESVLVLYPERRWELARSQALWPPLGVGLLMLVLTAAASLAIARRIGRRIGAVQRQVAGIGDGDFSQVELPHVDDELRDLSSGVNRMAVMLEASTQRIREVERSTLVTQLVGGLAHQLRNSLAGARMSLQLHRRTCREDQDEALHVALRQLSFTEEQIKALLRLTRGGASSPRPGFLAELLDETVSLIRPVTDHQKIALAYRRNDVDWEIPDADAMRAALLNLVLNAAEAAGPGGSVEVIASAKRDELVIEVVDDGPGISPQAAEAIFTPFYTTKPEGVGLGLSLAKQAVDDCGGVLTYERTGERTTFRITL